MKFIPPLIALAIVIGWIGNERRTISELEKKSAVLKQGLADLSASNSEIGFGNSISDTSASSIKKKQPIDWKKLAVTLLESQQDDDIGAARTNIRIQQRLQSMSREEFVSALKEIEALDMNDEMKGVLEQLIIGPLCQKFPELALTHYQDRLNDEGRGMSWQLSNAMKQWASKDLVSATAWLDHQIAAGNFDPKSLDGKSRPRVQFENVLLASLVSTDLDAANKRLYLMPQDLCVEVLTTGAQAIKESDQLAYANLVRKNMLVADQARVIAQQAGNLTHGEGYNGVTEYLDRIHASPDERSASVAEAANQKFQRLSNSRKITGDDIDSMREWAATQSPNTTDKLTGKVIANAIQGNTKLEFSEAADLALKYQTSSGNDDVLVGFLNSNSFGSHLAEARILAQNISDPEQREKILSKLK